MALAYPLKVFCYSPSLFGGLLLDAISGAMDVFRNCLQVVDFKL